jgi:hypothetical protein
MTFEEYKKSSIRVPNYDRYKPSTAQRKLNEELYAEYKKLVEPKLPETPDEYWDNNTDASDRCFSDADSGL